MQVTSRTFDSGSPTRYYLDGKRVQAPAVDEAQRGKPLDSFDTKRVEGRNPGWKHTHSIRD